MATITDFSTLQSNIADWLNRTDLTAQIPVFIQLAEKRLRRDFRARKLQDQDTFSISSNNLALPTDFDSMEAWYFDGPSEFGEIEIVPQERIGVLKALHGTSGVPRWAAIVDAKFVFAPAPDGTYATKMSYWRKFTDLSDQVTTNWLLTDHPDVYLFASLVESATFLKDDDRGAIWDGKLQTALEDLNKETERHQFSGTLRRRPRRPIG